MELETTQKHDTELGTIAWERLSTQVDKLAAAWESDDLPPDLAQFVPAERTALRRLLLVELIKMDLEFRWLRHELPKRIEEYVEEFPDLSDRGEVPCDLIYEEFHIRSQTAEPPRLDEYLERFPQQAEQLKRLLNIQTNKTSSTVIGGRGAPDIEVGQQIDDFDIITKLGKGAFASVYLARQRSMQRLVALKISKDRGNESQTLAQLDHPHIVRVYDQRVLSEPRVRLMYMQVIAGGTLHSVVDIVRHIKDPHRTGKTLFEAIDAALAARGESPALESSLRRRLSASRWPDAVCWLGARLASALDYAHERGVLHRDVKPANVLLTAEGSPKLADFNVSFSSKVSGASPAAYFGGSLAYMSPEQLEASNPDHDREANELDGRSDVFSIGVMIWELLTGRRPFGDEHFEGKWSDTLRKLTERRRAGLTPEMIMALPAHLPSGLCDVLFDCLSPNVADRPTAGVLSRRLELCLQPRAQCLIHPAHSSLRHWIRRWPLLAFVLAGLLPNVINSLLNIWFNIKVLVEDLGPDLYHKFQTVMMPVVNVIPYTLGTGLAFGLSWPVLRVMRRQSRLPDATPFTESSEQLAKLRRRSLWLGDIVGWITFVLWIGSGFGFAVWLHHESPPESNLDQRLYAHFVSTQLIFGLITFSQVYFLVTVLCLQSIYTALLPSDNSAEADAGMLQRLHTRCGWFFAIAISTPFLSIMLLATMSGKYATAMSLAAGVGFLCSISAWYLLRRIQTDSSLLAGAMQPGRDVLGGSDSESFWTASR